MIMTVSQWHGFSVKIAPLLNQPRFIFTVNRHSVETPKYLRFCALISLSPLFTTRGEGRSQSQKLPWERSESVKSPPPEFRRVIQRVHLIEGGAEVDSGSDVVVSIDTQSVICFVNMCHYIPPNLRGTPVASCMLIRKVAGAVSLPLAVFRSNKERTNGLSSSFPFLSRKRSGAVSMLEVEHLLPLN